MYDSVPTILFMYHLKPNTLLWYISSFMNTTTSFCGYHNPLARVCPTIIWDFHFLMAQTWPLFVLFTEIGCKPPGRIFWIHFPVYVIRSLGHARALFTDSFTPITLASPCCSQHLFLSGTVDLSFSFQSIGLVFMCDFGFNKSSAFF